MMRELQTVWDLVSYYVWQELGTPISIASTGTHYYGEEEAPFRVADHNDAYGSSLVNLVVGNKSPDADYEVSESATENEIKEIVQKSVRDYEARWDRVMDEV